MDIIHSSQHFPEIIPIIQTYERGVKFFVATSHYVAKDLDAGPIIEDDLGR
jgi:formyltetrahydrofolate deformylase